MPRSVLLCDESLLCRDNSDPGPFSWQMCTKAEQRTPDSALPPDFSVGPAG